VERLVITGITAAHTDNALQRTRSAPLRSPLDFKRFGDTGETGLRK
jgi:hypothetical protein